MVYACCQPIVVHAKQFEHGRHILRATNIEADPAAVREDMMWRSSPGRDQLLPHAHREWQIGEPAAVEMPDLVVVDLEFDPSKAVRLRRDARPTQYFLFDRVGDRHFVTSIISRASLHSIFGIVHRRFDLTDALALIVRSCWGAVLTLSQRSVPLGLSRLARISAGSTRQNWKHVMLLPVAIPAAVEH